MKYILAVVLTLTLIVFGCGNEKEKKKLEVDAKKFEIHNEAEAKVEIQRFVDDLSAELKHMKAVTGEELKAVAYYYPNAGKNLYRISSEYRSLPKHKHFPESYRSAFETFRLNNVALSEYALDIANIVDDNLGENIQYHKIYSEGQKRLETFDRVTGIKRYYDSITTLEQLGIETKEYQSSVRILLSDAVYR